MLALAALGRVIRGEFKIRNKLFFSWIKSIKMCQTNSQRMFFYGHLIEPDEVIIVTRSISFLISLNAHCQKKKSDLDF